MSNIGPMEIIGLLILALLLFGAKRLPEIGRSLGSGMREFKESVSGEGKKDEGSSAELPPPVATTPPPAAPPAPETDDASSPERETETVS